MALPVTGFQPAVLQHDLGTQPASVRVKVDAVIIIRIHVFILFLLLYLFQFLLRFFLGQHQCPRFLVQKIHLHIFIKAH